MGDGVRCEERGSQACWVVGVACFAAVGAENEGI